MEFKTLRKRYPQFIYEKYSFRISNNNLEIFFDFKIVSQKSKDNIKFKPKVVIKNINSERIKKLNKKILDNLIFHLGLIELFSYWKATCSPEIIIQAGPLSKKQILWWRNLIINGMGQFFYENQINFKMPNLLKIKNRPSLQRLDSCESYQGKLKNRILLPIGGGKDSIVTLEILKNPPSAPPAGGRRSGKKEIKCFSLNPTNPVKEIMKIGDCKKPIIVIRKIDKKLLELNKKGYLNGHTPFSAYLAFLSVLTALLFDYKYIVFSNERSSNEGNVKYQGKIINHQYSKSFHFEKKFRNYLYYYLISDIQYFSFLRPLYEIQIAKLFSRYSKYFKKFLSCNVAFYTDSGKRKPSGRWCGKCAKCLFIFSVLFPFIEEKKLIKIFGKNLFKDRELLSLMLQLVGERGFKPFECVGTKKESLIAFYLAHQNFKERRVKLPLLVQYFEEKILSQYPGLEKEAKKIFNSWNKEHNLPQEFRKILQKEVSKKD